MSLCLSLCISPPSSPSSLPHSTAEIPQFRLPYEVVQFEVDLMKDLGDRKSTRLNSSHL